MGREFPLAHLSAQRFLEGAPISREIRWWQRFARAIRQRLDTLQHLPLQHRREATGRLAHVAVKEGHDRLRESDLALGIQNILGLQSAGYHGQRHIPNDFGRGSDLHDVTEHLVDLRIGFGHIGPMMLDAQRPSLLAKIGVLAARHGVPVDVRGAATYVAFERRVAAAYRFPVA